MIGKILVALFLLHGLMIPAMADAPATVEQILSADTAPDGVVFEIITGDEDGLEWALPRVKRSIERLRQRFPDLSIAVVTHGEEMFALETGVQDSYHEVHQTVRSLLADDVTVHACGTFAGWRGLAGEDFPDYVDLSAAAPAQINDYLKLGYLRIVISDDD
ncbi:MAG TPA: hypothetical protein EYP40_05025 [Chromatiales bacterium]|nr:hypothetical protein [Chromatiales bacterium]